MTSHTNMATDKQGCSGGIGPFRRNSDLSDEIESEFDDSDLDKDFVPSEDEVQILNHEDEDFTDAGNESSSEETLRRTRGPTPEKTPKRRWRQRNEETYIRIQRKTRRNLGHEYKSDSTKKIVKAREQGPPCTCRNRCREKLQNCENGVFTKFWDLGSFNLQNSYLFGCIRVVKKKRSYPKKQKRQESSRKGNALYNLTINGQSIQVCKREFLNIHGLPNSRGRVDGLVSKKIRGLSVPNKDNRGKHINRPNKLSNNSLQSVRDHVNSIPTYQSHYSRNNNPTKKYFDCDMSISRLYKHYYIPWCQERDIEPVLEYAYRKIFCTEYNIGFKIPKSDTCKTCDQIDIRINSAVQENNEDEVGKLTTQVTLHKAKADAMRKLLISETERSKLTSKKLCRKIWQYNLGIHDCTDDQGHMFLWTENIAKRGSDEVASILLKCLSSKSNIDDLIIFTDNCPGQNKNWLMMSFWLHLVKEKRFKSITHHFLVSGHTYLPSDRDFGLIEKHHRNYAPIVYSPEQWFEIIKESNQKNPFKVTVMQQSDFLDFQPVLGSIRKALRTTDGDNLNFSGAFSFYFTSDNTKVFYVKHSAHGKYTEWNVTQKGRPIATQLSDLKKKYTGPLKISKKKLKNVKSLMPYISPIYHTFFDNLEYEDCPEECEENEGLDQVEMVD